MGFSFGGDHLNLSVNASEFGSLRIIDFLPIVYEVPSETRGENMFNVEQFIDECKRAVSGADGHKAVQALGMR